MTDDPRIHPFFAEVRKQALSDMDENSRRTLTCSRCDGAFGCNPVGKCWCSDESFKLPSPLPGTFASYGDCLCPKCLREVAEELKDLAPTK